MFCVTTAAASEPDDERVAERKATNCVQRASADVAYARTPRSGHALSGDVAVDFDAGHGEEPPGDANRGVYNTGGGPHFGSGLTINTAAGLYETRT